VTRRIEKLEKERMTQLKDFLQVYCDLEKRDLQHRLSHLNLLEEALKEMNIDNDMNLFLSNNRHPEVLNEWFKLLNELLLNSYADIVFTILYFYILVS
jgi:hypothetical protein